MEVDHSNLCNICLENVVSNGKRFGLFPSCEHTFCLDCVRTWRQQGRREDGEAVSNATEAMKCPVCRAKVDFIIPSKDFLTGEAKDRAIASYIAKVADIPCKNFSGVVGSCRFGKDCFYAHLGPDGEDLKPVDIERKSSSRRRNSPDLDFIDRMMVRELQLMTILAGRQYESDDDSWRYGGPLDYPFDSDDSWDSDSYY